MAILNPIWNKNPQTVDRVRGPIKAVITRAATLGLRALEICILCATTTTQTLKAKCQKIDLGKELWVIQANRMNGRKEHKIPLCKEAVTILKRIYEARISEYFFPNLSNGNHLSQAGISSVLKR